MEETKSINSYVENNIIENQGQGPTERTFAYYLEKADVSALNQLLWDFFYSSYRAKKFDFLRGVENKLTLALDGVSMPSSRTRHCDKCLSKTYGDKTYYYHAFLVASIVDRDTKFSFPVALIPIENSSETVEQKDVGQSKKKQDCELNATHRLLKHLRNISPHTKFNLSTDGLFLSANFISEAIERGHSVTMPLAKENMDIWEVLDVRLGNSKNKVERFTKDEEVTLWWEHFDVSNFWSSLKKKNSSIRLYGLKRQIVDLSTGEIKECIVVTTLELNSEKRAVKISNLQRSKWQEENKTFNSLKNLTGLKHIYNHKASAQVFQMASIALNMKALFILKCSPQKNIKKPLTESGLFKAIFKLLGNFKEMFQLPTQNQSLQL